MAKGKKKVFCKQCDHWLEVPSITKLSDVHQKYCSRELPLLPTE